MSKTTIEIFNEVRITHKGKKPDIKVFLEKDFGPLREKALEKLKSKESLIKLAKKINSPKWGQKLIEQISDPEILLDLTSSASHKKVRLFAKEKRDSLFKQTYGQSNLTNIHSSQNLKLIGEKVQNFISHHTESLAEAFLFETRKLFQNEKDLLQARWNYR